MISNCGHDENGEYAGGKAGDQTGGEYSVINWYSRPWACVLRYPDTTVTEKIAELSESAAKNNKVGYDQNQRLTYYSQLKAANWDPAKITTACESDCSASTSANIIGAGYLMGVSKLKSISASNTTSTLRKALVTAGFELLAESKYLTSDAYLLPGDILLYDGHHVAVNLTKGSKTGSAAKTYTVGWNQDTTGWWYADTTTSYYKSCWQIINGHKYRFNPDGYALTGWQEIDGKWYYFEPRAGHPLECAIYVSDQAGAQFVGAF